MDAIKFNFEISYAKKSQFKELWSECYYLYFIELPKGRKFILNHKKFKIKFCSFQVFIFFFNSWWWKRKRDMLEYNYDYTTCTVANSLNVTRFVSSGPGDCPPLVLITGFKGCRGFAVNNPADVASSLSFCDSPLCGLFGGGAMTCGNWLGVMYLEKLKEKQQQN